jgi:hypothetical protein
MPQALLKTKRRSSCTTIQKEVELISCTNIQKEVALINDSPKNKKDMTKLFHVYIHMRQDKVDYLFDLNSQLNLTSTQLV